MVAQKVGIVAAVVLLGGTAYGQHKPRTHVHPKPAPAGPDLTLSLRTVSRRVQGPLIERVVNRQRRALRACGADLPRWANSLWLSIGFAINSRGRVSSVSIHRSANRRAKHHASSAWRKIERCVRRVLRATHFPPHTGPVHARYLFGVQWLELQGGFGFGRSGFGPSRGGTGWGTIGTGRYGTIGHVGGRGVGHGRGGMAGHRPSKGMMRLVSVRSKGGLSSPIVRRYVYRRHPRWQMCTSRALLVHPKLAGDLTGTFTISPSGWPLHIHLRGLTPQVAACVARQLALIRFPLPRAKRPASVSLRFHLRNSRK